MDTYEGSGNATEDRLLIGEAAKYLGVSIDTLRRWDRHGLLVADRTLGGQRRYRRSVLDAALAAEQRTA